jgi:tRNA_anti-like
MRKNIKKLSLLFILLLAVAGGVGYYLYNKPVAKTTELKADFTLSSTELYNAFDADEEAANKKFNDKVIVVSGKVSEVDLSDAQKIAVMLDTGSPMGYINCSFYNEEIARVRNVVKGSAVTIKGKCTGKLADVILNTCSLVK